MSERDQAGRSSVGTKNQKQITSTCRTVDLEMFAHHVPDHPLAPVHEASYRPGFGRDSQKLAKQA